MNHLLLVFDSSSQTHIGEFGSPSPGLMLFQCFLNCMRERIMGVDCSVGVVNCQVVVIKLSRKICQVVSHDQLCDEFFTVVLSSVVHCVIAYLRLVCMKPVMPCWMISIGPGTG